VLYDKQMHLKLPPGDFKAYLFDCDGTVADSMPPHYIAWKRALDEWGATLTEEQFYGWGGLPAGAVIERLNQEQGLQIVPALLAERKEEFYYESLPSLKAVPEVLEHVLEAYGRIPIAIVSGSPRESVVASLTTLGLLHYFDTLVCAGDYIHGKPNPEPFLMAAERLGVAPADCLVFEDAEPGILAAKTAGMAWVKVPLPWERGV
jgi:HAD superfamily hydrolase (TIGR01509 family)